MLKQFHMWTSAWLLCRQPEQGCSAKRHGCVPPHSILSRNLTSLHSSRPSLSTLKESTKRRSWGWKKREDFWKKKSSLSPRRKLPLRYTRTRPLWPQAATWGRTRTARSKPFPWSDPSSLSTPLHGCLPCLLIPLCLSNWNKSSLRAEPWSLPVCGFPSS